MGEGSSDFITTDDDDDHEGDGPFAPRKAARPDLVRSRGEDGGRRKDEGKERKKGRASGLQPSVTTADSSQTKKSSARNHQPSKQILLQQALGSAEFGDRRVA